VRAGSFHRPDAGQHAPPLASHRRRDDSITARIARHLYPDADIRHQPFEEARLADGFYDVAISNIPFGDYKTVRPAIQELEFRHPRLFLRQGPRQGPAWRSGLVRHVQRDGWTSSMERCANTSRIRPTWWVPSGCRTTPSRRMPTPRSHGHRDPAQTAGGELPQGPAWKAIGESPTHSAKPFP